jgi:tungstate transport system ATP-binding protein
MAEIGIVPHAAAHPLAGELQPSLLPLEVEGLTYVVAGRTLIDRVDFHIRAGQRTVVLGPNGAGKSLLLQLCHGLLVPTAGRISWGGMAVAAAQRWQAMMFQRPVLLRRSAAANIAYALSVRGIPRAARAALVATALERVGLMHLASRPARTLSGGEQQRLALARAWVLEPRVLLLDEPAANLDPAATYDLERLIDAMHGAGTKIVMTTHDLGQARRVADEILFFSHGRLLEHAPAAEFFARPRSAAAAAFIEGRLFRDAESPISR